MQAGAEEGTPAALLEQGEPWARWLQPINLPRQPRPWGPEMAPTLLLGPPGSPPPEALLFTPLGLWSPPHCPGVGGQAGLGSILMGAWCQGRPVAAAEASGGQCRVSALAMTTICSVAGSAV